MGDKGTVDDIPDPDVKVVIIDCFQFIKLLRY